MRNKLLKKISTKTYYSFFTGLPYSKSSDWVFWDDKIPAQNLKQAMVFHYWLRDEKTFKNKKYPTLLSLQMYRMVYEFELIEDSKKGFTIVQYKKTAVRLPHDFLKGFKV